MPQLQDETYVSFLERNKRIAVHRVKVFMDIEGRPIRISDKNQESHSLLQRSRVGINRDKTQVLLFTGQIFFLYEKNGNVLKEIGRCAMWIS